MKVKIGENENKLGLEMSLEEMKHYHEEVFNGLAEIKKTTRSIFSAASIIIALLGVLQIFTVKVIPEYQAKYNSLIVASMILYGLLITGSVILLFPVKMKGAFPADVKTLKDRLIDVDDELTVYRQLIIDYVDAIHQNEPKVKKRYWLSLVVGILLPIIVALLLYMSTLPRVPTP